MCCINNYVLLTVETTREDRIKNIVRGYTVGIQKEKSQTQGLSQQVFISLAVLIRCYSPRVTVTGPTTGLGRWTERTTMEML